MDKRFTLYEDFLSLLFPRTCCLCNRSLFGFENQLCRICIEALPVTNYHLRPEDNDLKSKIMGLTRVNRVLSYLRFTKKGTSQKLLHTLKYRNKPELGNLVGKMYGQLLLENGFGSCWDTVIPVPLHPIKLKRRGYNQSERFAGGLAESLGLTVVKDLKRIRYTETQTNKSRLKRWHNVENVFSLDNQRGVSGKSVLLVDDVMTTGATLAACANVLLQSQAASVDLAVIAAGKT